MDGRDVTVLNFSNFDKCRTAKKYFRFKNVPFCHFVVEVHPNGIIPNCKGYVSVRILKTPVRTRAVTYMNIVHLSCTLSVVDVNGDARCSQSFVIENAAQFTNEEILDFQKRSHLLSRADELLPEDALTIRCEWFQIFVSADELLPKTKKERLIHLGISNITRELGKKRIMGEIRKIFSSNMDLDRELATSNYTDKFHEEQMKNMLTSYDALDEIRQTYLGSELPFREHLLLKETLRKKINDREKIWKDTFLSELSSLKGNSDSERHRMDMYSEVEKINEKNVKPTEKLLLNYNGNKEHDSTAEKQATWNLYLETMDGITFTIPFADGRETLGSKLVSRSKVFQEMVELNTKRQTPEEKVKLKDDSDTFINFLFFLQTEDIEVEIFPRLISLYIFADKYDVQELMFVCAERMQSFFSPSNIDEVEEFACRQDDEHLLELVQLYKEKNIQPVSALNKDTETLLNENSAALNEKRNDFDFYM